MLILKYPHARLVIIGTGENKNMILEIIKNKKLENNIDLLDYTNDIFNEIPKFDMHVLTSRYEGTPYVIFEAMALGVPVITTNTGGISNILTNNLDSMITEVEDAEGTYKAMDSLLISEDLRKSIIENAFKTVKNYTVQQMADNTEKFYLSKLHP